MAQTRELELGNTAVREMPAVMLGPDEVLESRLIDLVGRVQQGIEPLGRSITDPARALRTLEEKINDIAEFVDRSPSSAFPNVLERSLAVAAKQHPQAALVLVEGARIDLGAVIGLYRQGGGGAAARTSMVREVVAALMIVFDRLFAIIAFRFLSSELAATWNETCAILVTELGQAVAPIRF